jgi:ATP-dependent DNA helicase RecG
MILLGVNKEYQNVANVKERLATIELNDLVEKKILQKFGTTGRGTYYTVLKAQKPQERRTKGAKKTRKEQDESGTEAKNE